MNQFKKYFIIDALDGKIIQSYAANPDAAVTGNVQGEVYPENPTDPVTAMACRNQYVEIYCAGKTTTDNAGNYSKTVPWYWQWLCPKRATFTLEGPYARVQNSNGANYSETRDCGTSSPCNLTWTAAV